MSLLPPDAGVGEESGAELLHAVVELCFTSSVRFLQPGLLLKVQMLPAYSWDGLSQLGSLSMHSCSSQMSHANSKRMHEGVAPA